MAETSLTGSTRPLQQFFDKVFLNSLLLLSKSTESSPAEIIRSIGGLSTA